MPSLRRVLQTLARFLYRDSVFLTGEFTGENGAITAGTVKFKGTATITRSGEGVYVLTLLQENGSSALKGYSLKYFDVIAVAPNAADGGSGVTEITTDALLASGTVTFTMRNAAAAAADAIGRVLVKAEFAMEANS